jgi:hypothetical protein
MQVLVNGLTAVSRKVYDATPINEAWTVAQIDAELRRLGTPKSINMVAGCLDGLVRDGLVTEPARRSFQRVAARVFEPVVELPCKERPMNVTALPKKAAPPQSIIDRFSLLSNRARGLAAELNQLAEDIDEASLITDEQFGALSKDTVKLRQLQELLKGL